MTVNFYNFVIVTNFTCSDQKKELRAFIVAKISLKGEKIHVIREFDHFTVIVS